MSARKDPTSTASGTAEPGTVDTKLEAGRTDPTLTSFSSAPDLAGALRRASAAHGEHEKRIGKADPDWPDWYADYMVREQSGAELPL